MTNQKFALRKETELIEQRIENLTPLKSYEELVKKCEGFALTSDLVKSNAEVKKLERSLNIYCLHADMLVKLDEAKRDLSEQLELKVNNSVFQSRS